MRMIRSNEFNDKKILLVEKEPKTRNDRTWCFWEQEPGFFEDLVYHKWGELLFKTDEEVRRLKMGQYKYKMIRGIDFYNKCFSEIDLQKNIEVMYGEISWGGEVNNFKKFQVNNEFVIGGEQTIIFNSVYRSEATQKDKFYLLQHFKGWIIETKQKFFNPGEATLMDFSVSQTHGTTFVYVLPLCETKALVEYTIFSEKKLSEEEYNQELTSYLQNTKGLGAFTVVEEEFGIIPMTNAHLPRFRNGMYFIGTAGGATKPSTGYTFRFIQKQADEIVEQLIANGRLPVATKGENRFKFYDATLLHILAKKLLDGKHIFSTLFKKNDASKIFKFLDNESTVGEEIKLLNTLPKKVFMIAGFKEFLKMITRKNR